MKIILLLIAATAFTTWAETATTSTAPATKHKPTREEYVTYLNSMSKEDVIELHVSMLLGPNFVGKTLPIPVKGKTIAVFMSSSCPHCLVELPWYSKLDKVATAKGKYAIVPIFIDADANREMFLLKGGWTDAKFATVKNQDLANFPLRGTPTTLIVGNDGKVTASYAGELSKEEKEELTALVQ